MEIGDLVDSELMQLYPFDFAKDLYRNFVKYSEHEASAAAKITETKIETQNQTVNPSVASVSPTHEVPVQQPYGWMPEAPVQYAMPEAQNVNISPAQFQPFVNLGSPLIKSENIDLLLDVPLEVTVELGRTSKSIKEILDFAPGKIIELNRLAGEPIDVLVNGKYVAKGEVVVIEEAFGIRITDIIK